MILEWNNKIEQSEELLARSRSVEEEEREAKRSAEESASKMQQEIAELRALLETSIRSSVPTVGYSSDTIALQVQLEKYENELKIEKDNVIELRRLLLESQSGSGSAMVNLENHSSSIVSESIKALEEEISLLRREKKELQKQLEDKSSASQVGTDPNELATLFRDFELLQEEQQRDKIRWEDELERREREITQLKMELTALKDQGEEAGGSFVGVGGDHGPRYTKGFVRPIDRINRENAGLRKELEEVKSKLQQALSLSAKIPKSHDEHINELNDTIKKLRQENAVVQTKLLTEQAEANRLLQELKEARAELEFDASLREGPVFLSSSANSLSVSSSRAVEEGTKAMVVERDSLFKENKKLREQLEAKAKEVEDVRADTKVMEEIRYNASLRGLKDELSASKAKIVQLENQISQLQHELSGLSPLTGVVVTLEEKLMRLSLENEGLVQKHVDLKGALKGLEGDLALSHNEVELLKATVERMKRESIQHMEERVHLQGQIREKEGLIISQIDSLNKSYDDLKGLQAQNDTLKTELEDARAQLQVSAEKVLEMQETSSSMMSGFLMKIENLTLQLKEKSKMSSTLNALDAEKSLAIEKLNAEIASLREQLYRNEASQKSAVSSMINNHNSEIVIQNKKIGQLELEVVQLKSLKADAEMAA
eukprot:gene7774-9950_t